MPMLYISHSFYSPSRRSRNNVFGDDSDSDVNTAVTSQPTSNVTAKTTSQALSSDDDDVPIVPPLKIKKPEAAAPKADKPKPAPKAKKTLGPKVAANGMFSVFMQPVS